MEVGFASYSCGRPAPVELAPALEHRGFGALWVSEHSNIPYSANPVNGHGAAMPDSYKSIRDPLVSLAMAAAVTHELKLCTGMLLPLEQEPIHLAKSVASLDQLSGGRLRVGIGAGWNEGQHRNCAPHIPFHLRYTALKERVRLLRALWCDDVVAFEGRWSQISPAWVFPKPHQVPLPVLAGFNGALGVSHAIEYADGWCPSDLKFPGAYPSSGRHRPTGGSHDFDAQAVKRVLAEFRNRCADAGRDPHSMPIDIFTWNPDQARLELYGELGARSVVVMGMIVEESLEPGQDAASSTLHYLDYCASLIQRLNH